MEVNNIMSNEAKKSSPATISKANIVSNKYPDKVASVVNGLIRLTYHESILKILLKHILFLVMLEMLLMVSL